MDVSMLLICFLTTFLVGITQVSSQVNQTDPSSGKINNQAILAELLACSAKSSKPVNECRTQYNGDNKQYGRPYCCAYAKLVHCLNETLDATCAKWTKRLLETFVEKQPSNCEEFVYPSFNCTVAVNWNFIFGSALAILIASAGCALYFICKCLCALCHKK